MGLRHLGLGAGDRICIMSRTRPAWLTADLASLSIGAVSCPIYPSVEPGQAAYVINNVKARAVFVENAQQAAKIVAVRDQCPTLEHMIVIDDRGKVPAGGAELRRHLRSVHGDRGGARRLGGRLARESPARRWRPSSTPRGRRRTRRA